MGCSLANLEKPACLRLFARLSCSLPQQFECTDGTVTVAYPASSVDLQSSDIRSSGSIYQRKVKHLRVTRGERKPRSPAAAGPRDEWLIKLGIIQLRVLICFMEHLCELYIRDFGNGLQRSRFPAEISP